MHPAGSSSPTPGRAPVGAGTAASAVLDALDAAPFGVAIFDRELRFVHVNSALAAWNGLPVEAHHGHTMRELFPGIEEPIATVEARVRAVLETGHPAAFSVVRAAPGAQRQEWAASYFPVRGAAGEIHAACGIVTDVTAERERDAALQRAREEAERTARRLSYLLEVSSALSAASDPSSVAQVVVERARDLVGASEATLRVVRGDELDLLAASAEREVPAVARASLLGANRPCSVAAASGEPVWLSDRESLEARFPAAALGGIAALAALPLFAHGVVLGTLGLRFARARAFDLEERAFLLAVADECARALDRALGRAAERAARADAQRLAGRLARLQEITAALSGASTAEEVASVLVRAAHAVLGAETAVTYVLDPGGRTISLVGAFGRASENRARLARLALDAPAPVARAARTGEAYWLETRAEIEAAFPRFGDVNPYAADIGAVAALPLRARGEVLGSLGFAYERERRFFPAERELLSAVSDQCAQALDRARLLDAERAARADVQRLAEDLARLQAITAALSGSRTPDEIVHTMTEQAHAVVGAAVSIAFALEPDGEHLRLLGVRGAAPDVPGRFERVHLTAPLPICHAVRAREPVWMATRDEMAARFPELTRVPEAARRGAAVALPLSAGGTVLGAIGFTFDTPRRFDTAERNLFLGIAEQCGVALERARLLEQERRAREAAERAREEADGARALLDALVQNAPLGIGFFDREFRYRRVNPRLAEMNGLPVAAHLGRTPREVLPFVEALDGVEATWRRVMETGEPLLDLPFVTKAPGEPRPRAWVLTWYPVRADGEIVGVGALVRDVTNEREAEQFQRHVMGVVGHDVRSPLSAIVNSTAVLLASDPAPVQARLLRRIASSASRIEEIVRTLLDYASVRGGRGVPIHPRRCDVAEIARAVAEECRLADPAGELRCSGEGDCTGEWDPDRIAQVLTNLVSNALRHATGGSAVEVRWRGSEADVVLEVENAGAEISPEGVAHLFEPFRQGEAGGGGALGLGLFIARAIVDAHRGAIDVRSGAGRTVFAVRLPRG